jgi:hypothetical protein
MQPRRIPSIQSLLARIPREPLASLVVGQDVSISPDPAADGPPSGAPQALAVHGSWQSGEDEKLRDVVAQSGTSRWDCVSALITGRSPTQCRERWMFRISPGLNKGPFQSWEDELIFRERERVGNHWTLISGKLPGRTSCAVKNRWYSALRRRARVAHPPADDDEDALSITRQLSHPMNVRSLAEINI